MKRIDVFKRGSLCIIPIFISMPFFFNISSIYLYYIPGSILLSATSIFVNFPIFIKILHTRPVYYEDILLLDSCVDNPYHLQNIFLYINGFTSILFFIISGLYFYIKINSNIHIIDAVGIFGGIAILYSKIQMYIGKGILTILFYIKNKRYNNDAGIEMIQLRDVESQVSDNRYLTDMPWLWCWCDNPSHKCNLCNSRNTSRNNSTNNSVRSSPRLNIPISIESPKGAKK